MDQDRTTRYIDAPFTPKGLRKELPEQPIVLATYKVPNSATEEKADWWTRLSSILTCCCGPTLLDVMGIKVSLCKLLLFHD
jgi:hypothetical protein